MKIRGRPIACRDLYPTRRYDSNNLSTTCHPSGGRKLCARVYDLKTLKVKRRGMLRDLPEPGALPYQTQINQALRQAMQSETEGIKDSLLKDPEFIRAVANEINKR